MRKSVVLTDILEITRLKITLISVFLFHNKECDFHTGFCKATKDWQFLGFAYSQNLLGY